MDVSDYWDIKIEALKAFKSQFYDPQNSETETYISRPGFIKMIEARASEWGYAIGSEYGEGFTTRRYPGVNSLFDLR